MPESQVRAAAGMHMLAGAKDPKRRQTLRKLGLGRPAVRLQNQRRGENSSWGPRGQMKPPSRARQRQPGHPSVPHKATVKGPYA